MKRQCSVRVFGDRVRDWMCNIPATVQKGGKWYCHVHDPERMRVRQQKHETKYQAERRADILRWKFQAAKDKVVRVADQYVTNNHPLTKTRLQQAVRSCRRVRQQYMKARALLRKL